MSNNFTKSLCNKPKKVMVKKKCCYLNVYFIGALFHVTHQKVIPLEILPL